MSERYIDITNWDRFQHMDVWRKSGGRPPWIKNYTQLLHKDEYMDLSQSQRGILHGLWLMYASAGRSLGEAGAKRRLCRSDAEAKWWRRNLEALRNAGFIEILSQPIRAPVAPRVEEKRKNTPYPHEVGENGQTKRAVGANPRTLGTNPRAVAEKEHVDLHERLLTLAKLAVPSWPLESTDRLHDRLDELEREHGGRFTDQERQALIDKVLAAGRNPITEEIPF